MSEIIASISSYVSQLVAQLPLDSTGQGMAEYGLILALVAVVVIGALVAIGGGIGSTLNTVSGSL